MVATLRDMEEGDRMSAEAAMPQDAETPQTLRPIAPPNVAHAGSCASRNMGIGCGCVAANAADSAVRKIALVCRDQGG
jgi:hypothetical protein